ncbi:TrkH family potassium uptake protein [Kiritimatiella glycovorans]|uniref:Ktr system potassium uptake protein B n=1 Tax=Kiritimatiella glycovorans TaxID=1307763 RepID=A0A0G3ELJ5_9BACT|nr:TrkH family potassium uptake protein [Kiritimatiella glycovorans]AKJ65014.1 Ktr system potassium uptake protein B [Kiritimatiella glycovorans]
MNPALRLWQRFLKTPSRVPVAGFALLIVLGTLALSLPAATLAEGRLALEDAVFTATSAVCVTGLVVRDTALDFTLYGQLVILALIQVGGIGIMSISTLFLLLVRRRTGMTERVVLRDFYTHTGEYSSKAILIHVTKFTFAAETLGALLLYGRFMNGYPPHQALYLSVFHSVSAFCNAGFSLFSDSFINYVDDPVVNLTLAGLIIAGGLGFLVVAELQAGARRKPHRWRRLSLHTKLVLTSTAVLIAAATTLIFSMERGNTLLPLEPADRLMASFFQAVSCRTAGFNTLDIGGMTNETLFSLMILMFIGAAPGSCGGGIKVTTAAVLVMLGWFSLRGRTSPRVFRRTIPEESVYRALSLFIVGIVVVAAGTVALQITELAGVPHSESHGRFLELAFEAVSAFGTVGLSTGLTASLSAAGKGVITILMFVGRLGPLAIALAISRSRPAYYRYAEETIMIG